MYRKNLRSRITKKMETSDTCIIMARFCAFIPVCMSQKENVFFAYQPAWWNDVCSEKQHIVVLMETRCTWLVHGWSQQQNNSWFSPDTSWTPVNLESGNMKRMPHHFQSICALLAKHFVFRMFKSRQPWSLIGIHLSHWRTLMTASLRITSPYCL